MFAQFIKPVSTKNLLSTEKYCLAETGYQPKLHEVYIVVIWCPTRFLLSKEICQAVFLLKSLFVLYFKMTTSYDTSPILQIPVIVFNHWLINHL